MTEWTMICWQGSPEDASAALRALGWHAAGEEPADAVDPRIGGFIPAAGQAPQTFDGVAYVAVAAQGEVPLPPGLAPAGPELFRALLGGF
ncbi:hypothetical protein [Falsiroseomonas sp.]|uniref:hypothetical protein n=1 Tax=Falsiroseomonas sp. TaxID=2870721 RepID=UPI00271E8434|nr:hypothetical protein [Falsiroseomonas sp.]MDO9498457.1 hypothetical protein [Falsiroseomonas sp.]MDP3416517.1 hypothetical protein [Falsiroseomonas sp.]